MNHIEKIRAEMKQYFSQELFTEGSKETSTSPSSNFRIELTNYHQSKPNVNWDITKVDIFDNMQDEIILASSVTMVNNETA